MNTLAVGDVVVKRIEEMALRFPMPPDQFFTNFDRAEWAAEEEGLTPQFFDPEANGIVACSQIYVIESDGTTIVVDCGLGNDKSRPSLPVFDHLHSSTLDKLHALGVSETDVDIVVNTHLHVDHVGWNTVLDGNRWAPTFPNARYLVPKLDWEFFDPALDRHLTRASDVINENVHDDSLRPIAENGQLELIEPGHKIGANITLVDASGHTPGQVSVHVRSKGEAALFVGDVVHHPIQLRYPWWGMFATEDRARDLLTRRRILSQCADQKILLLPAAFAHKNAVWIRSDGPGFQVDRWADWE